jgi:hypothetical protein
MVVRARCVARWSRRWWRRAPRADRSVAIALAITIGAAGVLIGCGIATGAFIEDFRIEHHEGH